MLEIAITSPSFALKEENKLDVNFQQLNKIDEINTKSDAYKFSLIKLNSFPKFTRTNSNLIPHCVT